MTPTPNHCYFPPNIIVLFSDFIALCVNGTLGCWCPLLQRPLVNKKLMIIIMKRAHRGNDEIRNQWIGQGRLSNFVSRLMFDSIELISSWLYSADQCWVLFFIISGFFWEKVSNGAEWIWKKNVAFLLWGNRATIYNFSFVIFLCCHSD